MNCNYRIPLFTFVLALPIAFVGCDSAEPDVEGPGEEELITTVLLSLDGPGDDDPEVEVSDA
ncbi:MAG: hypothetical protein R3362_05475, partial [Rhodothermales bacterium]|nr:hypothetical protein [Rhodothermales bacterium]